MSRRDVASVFERDGRTYPGHRDPPGQSSIYIQPGDERRENYRLSTFSQFPETPVNPSELAEAGFYFTGFRDRVKCFSCGLCVENWVIGDNPKERRWHKTDCEFATGNDATNVPLPRVFSTFLTSGSGMGRVPARHVAAPPVSTQERAPENRGTPPRQNCGRDVAPGQNNSLPNGHEPYPCRDPVNPLMQSFERRLETFRPERGPQWPPQRIRAPIHEIADAGFFYLGERDRVKCWYCNGGLQNWDYNDDPWTEHAKWFPSCEFVLRSKGYNFVQTIVSQFPNLKRPTPIRRAPTLSPPSIPPNEVEQSSARNLENAILHFPFTTLGLEMGYTPEVIKEVLERKYRAAGKLHSSSEEFIHDLIASEPRDSTSSLPSHPSICQNTNIKQHETNESGSSLAELRKLEEERLCKTCKRNKSDIVYIPCGHIASCSQCSVSINHCSICGRRVQDKIKMFRA